MKIFLKFVFLLSFIFLSPLILLAMLAVFIEDGSPVLFVQKRLGKDKKEFNLYKIRTMKNFTPSLGTHEIQASNHLKVGSLLRKTKIDELPQIINFIKGDLNIVGPRPGLPSQNELTMYRKNSGVFNIYPGITGLSQVLGYDMSNPELLSKIDYLYVNKMSISLDIDIFIATFMYAYRDKIKNNFKNELKEIHDDL